MTNSPDRTGLVSLSLGSTLFLGSNFLGHGVGTAPDLRGGLLLAAAGMLFFVLAENRLLRWRARGLHWLQVVLAVGVFSVVAELIVRDLQEFHRMAVQDWGAIPSPPLMFSTLYALASLFALLGFGANARRRQKVMEELPADADWHAGIP